jgi:hypothetical protein
MNATINMPKEKKATACFHLPILLIRALDQGALQSRISRSIWVRDVLERDPIVATILRNIKEEQPDNI